MKPFSTHLSSSLRAGLFLLIGLVQPLGATPMELTINGYVFGGTDYYGSTLNLPAGIPYKEAIEVNFRYDTANLGPEIYSTVYGLNNGSKLHDNRANAPAWWSPSDYASFLTADFTVNDITTAMDTRWSSKIDFYRFWDSLAISGSANRTPIDPNGGQANEGISFSAHLGGQLFDPLNPMTLANPNGSIGEGFIRLFDDPGAQYRSYYPENRFTDGQLHWVEIYYIATGMDLHAVTANPGNGHSVPDSGSTVGFLALAATALGLYRRPTARA